ncbi:unnamed protein product, partial [Protopolystoma xenopodis]
MTAASIIFLEDGTVLTDDQAGIEIVRRAHSLLSEDLRAVYGEEVALLPMPNVVQTDQPLPDPNSDLPEPNIKGEKMTAANKSRFGLSSAELCPLTKEESLKSAQIGSSLKSTTAAKGDTLMSPGLDSSPIANCLKTEEQVQNQGR